VEFGLLVVGGFAILIGLLLAVGRFYPGSGAEQLDWKPTRSPEVEIELELEDIEQMLELQNERRRRRGAPELTEDELRLEVEAAERERRARSERYRTAGSEPGDARHG
jgi:hypothetical protein